MQNRKFKIYRGDNNSGELIDYSCNVSEGMVVLDAIHRIQADDANDMACRWNCKAGKCGSCSVEINGKPKLACMTRMNEFEEDQTLTITPLKSFPVIRDIVTDVNERYLVYEAYKRHVQNMQPFNLKWIEFTLKLSFPKVLSLANNLIANGFLIKEKSSYDKRVNNLKPTKKLIDGIELFESMKMNELFIQNVEINYVDGLKHNKKYNF